MNTYLQFVKRQKYLMPVKKKWIWVLCGLPACISLQKCPTFTGGPDPLRGQVLTMHPSGQADSESDPEGQRPGERIWLLCSEWQLWMCADPQQWLLRTFGYHALSCLAHWELRQSGIQWMRTCSCNFNLKNECFMFHTSIARAEAAYTS